jgi:hypothetical protein
MAGMITIKILNTYYYYSMMTRFCSPKKLRTNRNQSLYFLWNTIEIMAFVTIMSTRWIQFKVFNFQQLWAVIEGTIDK